MNNDDSPELEEEIHDLELVHWVDEKSSMRGAAQAGGFPVKELYVSYEEVYAAILEHGPLVYGSSRVDVMFFAVSGTFDGDIVAVRQSGRNVRRFLIREDLFEKQYGNFENCLNHIQSNNAVDCEIEIKHLYDIAEKLKLSATEIDPARDYDRLEVDITAALQMLHILDELNVDDAGYSSDFELGYCVGRLFSSAQNLTSLEPDARRAAEYEQSYRERGKKGKSQDRRGARLEHLFACIAELVAQNPALSRLKPIEVAKLAVQDAVAQNPGMWTQGRGQLEQYLTCFASEPKYRIKYRELFPETA